MKYSPNAILQILISFYNYQVAFDPEVERDELLTFNTKISDWRMICDLIEPLKVAEYFYELFNLKTPIADLERFFLEEDSKTIGDFCNYIATNSKKTEIKPVLSFGRKCLSSSIYKILIHKLNSRGIDTKDIKLSSKFVPLFYKDADIFLEEVNKLAPGALTKFEYDDNKIVKLGWSIITVSVLSLILLTFLWQFHWSIGLFIGFGIITVAIGKQYKPKKELIGGYDTIKDLIKGMETVLIKTANNAKEIS